MALRPGELPNDRDRDIHTGFLWCMIQLYTAAGGER